MWFDAPMDRDEARIEELERGFRRDGLPNLVVDYSAAEDVFTRALPFFALVFAVEVVVAVDAELGWTGIALVAAVLATLVMAFGVMNAVRGQRFFSVPERVDTPELVAFVVLQMPAMDLAAWMLMTLAFVCCAIKIIQAPNDEWDLPPLA